MLEAKKLELKKVILDYDVNNIVFDKMQAKGEVLMRIEINPTDSILTNIYLLDLNKCIKNINQFIMM